MVLGELRAFATAASGPPRKARAKDLLQELELEFLAVECQAHPFGVSAIGT
jgi:hypothetical protein